MATANSNFDALVATTLKKYKPRLTDNVFKDRPFTYWIMDKGRMRFEDGGTTIVEPIIHGSNDTVASYSDYDTVALTPQTGISAAEFQWRQLAGSIAISGIEEFKNSGEAQVLKLLDAKVMQLEESLKDKFGAMFFAASPGAKDFDSLPVLISATGTVGGIDSSTTPNAFWRSYVNSTAAALTIAMMRTAYNTAANGNDVPDLGLTTQALYENYEGMLTASLRYTDTKMADAGFENLLFKRCPIVFDKQLPTGQMYFLNSKYIQLVGSNDKWMDQTGWVRPENMDARYALILSYGNLTIRNRSRHAVLTAKT